MFMPIITTLGTKSQLDGNAQTSDVLNGKTFFSSSPTQKLIGSMPNNGKFERWIDGGDWCYIPKGYHDGSGFIEATTKVNAKILNAFGFRNCPAGNWVIKSTATGGWWGGYNNNVIPLVASEINCNYSQQMTGGTEQSKEGKTYINGGLAAYGKTHIGGLHQYNNMNVIGQAIAYNVFIPAFYGMDLSATQNYRGGNISVWLQKV